MANKIIFLMLLGVFFLTDAQSQNSRTISGEGKVVSQEIQLDNFHEIGLSFSGKVILTQGSPQKIVIEGQQNIIDNIKKEVRGGSWNIEFDRNVKKAEPVTITITIPMLDEIALSGSGTILSTNTFRNIDKLEIGMSGSGHVDFGFEAKSTELAMSGSGKANLSGTSNDLEISMSGSGSVNAKDLVTKKCEVNISGSGNAAVHVNGDLRAAISGSGNVTYTGSVNVDAAISGSGRVSKI